MTRETFRNLSDEKKGIIIKALREEFEEYPILDASVSSIVKRAGISRGSFYQYFESLESSFFTILEMEIVEIHDGFIDLIRQEKGDLFSALKKYGEVISDEIFKIDKYNLYRNRYLYWTCELDQKWKEFHKESFKMDNNSLPKEVINFLNAVIKKLIENLFIENWDKKKILEMYNQYMYWVEHGLGKEEELYGTF